MIMGLIAAATLQSAVATSPADVSKRPVTAPAPSASTAKASDGSKKVCRRQTPTGSVIERRFCKTQAEWDSEAAGAASFVAEIQRDYTFESSSEYIGPGDPRYGTAQQTARH